MIIYKIQESGEATDFQYSISRPDGWWSIDDTDKIPSDTTQFNEKKYINSELLRLQKQTLINLLNDSDKKANGDWPYIKDIPSWIEVRKKWREILKSDKIQDIPKKPFGS